MGPSPGSQAGAKYRRDRLRQQMTDHGCTRRDIAAEMRVRFGVRAREAWRHAHGLTLQQAADRLNALAATRPGQAVAADASLLGKWEKWPGSRRKPAPGLVSLLAELYGCTTGDLLDFEDRQALHVGDPLLLLSAAAAPASTVPADPVAPPASVPAAAAPGPAELVELASEEAAAWAQWAESSNVGDIAFEQLLADTQALAARYLCEKPARVFRDTRALRNRVFALLEGHQHPRQSADLYMVAGYLCGLLAWMSCDLGQPRRADTQGRTAWLCAELAGHDTLRAWVLSTRSKVAFWDGRLKDAITLARRGADLSPHGTAGVLLACQEADAWSRLGAAEETRAALGRAAQAQETIRGRDDVDGLFSCGDFRRVNYDAAVHLRIGAPEAALREGTGALTDPAPHAYGTAAQLHITVAAAHLALGEPEGAAEALGPVLALPPEQRLAPVATRLQEFATAVARSPVASGRTASTLQSAVEAWYLDSAPRRLALSPGALGD
ncbi:helix-turn-helix domain-containing protein [Streptomyces chrestomyceticus]|uniref:helix-turn-helix domain-containing protein n=1 Tax=Streptomyces chrestomyceticus TaxID=68185 RepID=UPI003698B2ED